MTDGIACKDHARKTGTRLRGAMKHMRRIAAATMLPMAFSGCDVVTEMTHGRAVALLDRIEREARLTPTARGAVVRHAADGPSPEMAERRMTVAMDAASIGSAILRGCRTLGMHGADAERRTIEPDAVCEGGPGAEGDSVHLWTSCRKPQTCTVDLQVQVTG